MLRAPEQKRPYGQEWPWGCPSTGRKHHLLGRSWQLQDGWDNPQEPLLKVPRALKETKFSWQFSKASPCTCWKFKKFPRYGNLRVPAHVQVSAGISVPDFPARLFQVSAATVSGTFFFPLSLGSWVTVLPDTGCPVTCCSLLSPGLQVLIYNGIYETHKWCFTPSIHQPALKI